MWSVGQTKTKLKKKKKKDKCPLLHRRYPINQAKPTQGSCWLCIVNTSPPSAFFIFSDETLQPVSTSINSRNPTPNQRKVFTINQKGNLPPLQQGRSYQQQINPHQTEEIDGIQSPSPASCCIPYLTSVSFPPQRQSIARSHPKKGRYITSQVYGVSTKVENGRVDQIGFPRPRRENGTKKSREKKGKIFIPKKPRLSRLL